MSTMRRWSVAGAILLTIPAIVFLQMEANRMSAEQPAGTRKQQWQKVDEAVKKGLPKTAIEQLQPIIDGALKDKAYPEAIRAIAKKIALEGTIQGNKPEEKITRMQE